MTDRQPTSRCFIALEISEEVMESVTDLLSTFRQAGADIRWIRPEAMHLTIKFLGELDTGQVDTVKEVLREVVPGQSPFSIKVSGVGGFPSLNNPKVIWAGIPQSKELETLHMSLDKALAEEGFEPDSRIFVPHLTLGRIRSRSNIREALPVIQDAGGHAFGKIDVSEVILMKSHLRPEGPLYSDLVRVRLGE